MGTCRKIWNCCCCLCVNWIFSWVNNGAYTFIHLSGDPYCTSAIEVFAVRIKDMVLTGVVSILSVVIYSFYFSALPDLNPNRNHGADMSRSLRYGKESRAIQNRSN